MEINITVQQLTSIVGAGLDQNLARTICRELRDVSEKYGIDTPLRMAMFIAQTAHESQGFTKKTESLNYSIEGLVRTFKYYTNRPAEAAIDGRSGDRPAKQEVIANKVYDDKYRDAGYKLGNIHPGDGWAFRGGAFIQITGRDAWTEYARTIGLDVRELAQVCRENDRWAMDAAAWFFARYKNLLQLADQGNITEVSRRIQGGTQGLTERMGYYSKAKRVLGI